jgi:hypothetical protein
MEARIPADPQDAKCHYDNVCVKLHMIYIEFSLLLANVTIKK